MRELDTWIEPTIRIMLIVCAILAVAGIVTVAHFVLKFW